MKQLDWHLEKRNLKDLKDYSKNPQTANQEQRSEIRKSIKKFTLIEKPIINLDDTIIGGHSRRSIEMELGKKIIACWVPNRMLTDEEVKELNIRLNKNHGEMDKDILVHNFGMHDLLDWGFKEDEIADDYGALEPEVDFGKEGNSEEPILKNKEAIVHCKIGDCFDIDGRHILLCADATQSKSYETLLGKNRAHLVFTDPPYNINYKSSAANSYDEGKYGHLKSFEDDKTLTGYHYFIAAVVENLYKFTASKTPIYFWMGGSFEDIVKSVFRINNYSIQPDIVWLKNGIVFGHGTYHNCYERAGFFWKEGKRPYYNRKLTAKERNVWLNMDKMTFVDYLNVWYEMRDNTSKYVHPTQKPINLALRAIRNTSKVGDIILDVFGGSGSTLLAANNVDRRCYMMEYDPFYIDVIIRRYKEFFPNAKIKCLNRKFNIEKIWMNKL